MALRGLLRRGDLRGLFNELGWDNLRAQRRLTVGDDSYSLGGIAEKRGVQVFQCEPGPNGGIPSADIRAKIDTQLRVTAAMAVQRNAHVSALADVLFVPHASPGGKTEALALAVLAAAKPVLTLDDPGNAALVSAGATPVDATRIVAMARSAGRSSHMERRNPSHARK